MKNLLRFAWAEVLECILQEGGKKPTVSHSPEITHKSTQKLSSLVPPISESCRDQVMLQWWLLDCGQVNSPVWTIQVGLSQGLLQSELQHGGFILVAASCPQLLFLWRSLFHRMGVHAPIHLISIGRIKLPLTEYMQKTQGNVMKNSTLEYPGKESTWHVRCFIFPFILFFHLCRLVQSH